MGDIGGAPITSNHFERIPLVFVEATLEIGEPRPLELDKVWELRTALRDQLPNVSEVIIPNLGVPPPSMSASVYPQSAIFENPSGIRFAYRPNLIAVSWSALPGNNYPRYEYLRDILSTAAKFIVGGYSIARIQYRIIESPRASDISYWDWISEDYIPPVVAGDTPTSNIAIGYILPNDVSYQFIATNDADGVSIVTQGAKVIEITGGIEALEEVHEAMTVAFDKAISRAGKSAWGQSANSG